MSADEVVDVLQVLGDVRRERDALRAREAQLREVEISAVVEGRRLGLRWDQLGTAMGTTKQAAQQRYGLLVQLAESRRAAETYRPPPAPDTPRVRPGPPAHGARQQPKKRRK